MIHENIIFQPRPPPKEKKCMFQHDVASLVIFSALEANCWSILQNGLLENLISPESSQWIKVC